MHEFVVAVIAFVVLLGLMVVVHEFGHFAVAKFFKIRVEAFSVGFGPRLFGIKYGETDYKICLLPLGGYVKMTGENPGEEAQLDDPGAFNAHPRWQRMLVGLAGPVANFILAFVLMVFYFGWLNEVPDIKTPVVEWVTPGSTADQAGIKPGDIIRSFDKHQNPDWYTVVESVRDDANHTVPVSVDRNGSLSQTMLRLPARAKGKEFDLSDAGLFLQDTFAPIVVDQVLADSPADKAGLRSGDSITAVDGHPFHTIVPLLDYLKAGQGRPITLSVVRGGAAIAPIVVHPSIQESQWRLGFMQVPPVDAPSHIQPMSFSDAVVQSREFCAESSLLIIEVVQKLLTHQASVKQLSGPVGIARMAGSAAETKDWSPKFGLAAGISLNLGILNLMPFPILDGGLILLLLIESTIRRDISMMVKERIYQAAFVVLVSFFAFVLFNDVSKLPIFMHLKP